MQKVFQYCPLFDSIRDFVGIWGELALFWVTRVKPRQWAYNWIDNHKTSSWLYPRIRKMNRKLDKASIRSVNTKYIGEQVLNYNFLYFQRKDDIVYVPSHFFLSGNDCTFYPCTLTGTPMETSLLTIIRDPPNGAVEHQCYLINLIREELFSELNVLYAFWLFRTLIPLQPHLTFLQKHFLYNSEQRYQLQGFPLIQLQKFVPYLVCLCIQFEKGKKRITTKKLLRPITSNLLLKFIHSHNKDNTVEPFLQKLLTSVTVQSLLGSIVQYLDYNEIDFVIKCLRGKKIRVNFAWNDTWTDEMELIILKLRHHVDEGLLTAFPLATHHFSDTLFQHCFPFFSLSEKEKIYQFLFRVQYPNVMVHVEVQNLFSVYYFSTLYMWSQDMLSALTQISKIVEAYSKGWQEIIPCRVDDKLKNFFHYFQKCKQADFEKEWLPHALVLKFLTLEERILSFQPTFEWWSPCARSILKTNHSTGFIAALLLELLSNFWKYAFLYLPYQSKLWKTEALHVLCVT